MEGTEQKELERMAADEHRRALAAGYGERSLLAQALETCAPAVGMTGVSASVRAAAAGYSPRSATAPEPFTPEHRSGPLAARYRAASDAVQLAVAAAVAGLPDGTDEEKAAKLAAVVDAYHRIASTVTAALCARDGTARPRSFKKRKGSR